MTLHLNTEKLRAQIAELVYDVKGVWSTSNMVVGDINGTLIRIEAIAPEEAEDLGISLKDQANASVFEEEYLLPDSFAELDYLRFFFNNTDFGPAHEDVVDHINESYTNLVGRPVPEGYQK